MSISDRVIDRNVSIDLVKIFAMFMVSFYHIGYYKLNYEFCSNVFYFPNTERLIMNLCNMGVPLFFLASGFLMLNKKYLYSRIIKKVVTILVIGNIWNFITPFPIWFLYTLCLLYLIQPVLNYIKNKNWLVYVLLIFIISVPSFFYNLYLEIDMWLRSSNVSLARSGCFTTYSIVYFALGGSFLVKYFARKYWILAVMFFVGYALAVLEGVIISNSTHKMFDGVNASFPTIGALLMSFSVFIFIVNIDLAGLGVRVKYFIDLIAKNCLAVYIWHCYFSVFIFLLIKFDEFSLIDCLFLTIMVDGVCFGLGYFVSKIPYARSLIKF